MTNKEKLEYVGLDNVIVFESPSYDTAMIGTTEDVRAVYDYQLMVEFLMNEDGMTSDDACEFIDYNTIRALHYGGYDLPIVIHRFEDMGLD